MHCLNEFAYQYYEGSGIISLQQTRQMRLRGKLSWAKEGEEKNLDIYPWILP